MTTAPTRGSLGCGAVRAGDPGSRLDRGAVVSGNRKRRPLKVSLDRQLRFETVVTDLLLALAQPSASGTRTAVDTSLRRAAQAVGLDDVWLWTFGDPRDPEWTSPGLQSGRSVTFALADELPRALRDSLTARSRDRWSVAATPLHVGGLALGALFWVSFQHRLTWPADRLEQLRILSVVFADCLERQRASDSLEQSDVLKGAILRSLPGHVAVLDRRGMIIAVNESWANVWPAPDAGPGELIGPGVDFLDACAAAARAGAAGAAGALAGVASVCNGSRSDFELEYRRDDAGDERWFLMTATPLRREDGGAVVVHAEITDRKRAEIAERESEGHFRQLANSLPMGIWVAGPDAARMYFNQTWLEMTGRRLEQELGLGWLEGVHPDDREPCMAIYARAFAARERFSMEYRLRRRDGQYHWVRDDGVPRYDTGATLLGYHGGVIDRTDYRGAQDALSDVRRRLIGAQEQERARIGRELHDNVSQRLAVLAIKIDEIRKALPASAVKIAARIASLRAVSRDVAHEVHDLSHRLHSIKLEALGLVGALRGHCRELSRYGIRVQFSEVNVPAILSDDAALCVFRVAQEALANVVKHSGAAEARVVLSGGDGEIVLRVEDSGRGFAPDTQSSGLGLSSMRERVRLAGGDITICSTPRHGAVIEARVPIDLSRLQAGRSLPAA